MSKKKSIDVIKCVPIKINLLYFSPITRLSIISKVSLTRLYSESVVVASKHCVKVVVVQTAFVQQFKSTSRRCIRNCNIGEVKVSFQKNKMCEDENWENSFLRILFSKNIICFAHLGGDIPSSTGTKRNVMCKGVGFSSSKLLIIFQL